MTPIAKKEVVRLAPNLTCVRCDGDQQARAIEAAYRVTMSPCEWEWTDGEQAAMAQYVLWAYQRICVIQQSVNDELRPYEE